MKHFLCAILLFLSGCGSAYISPDVKETNGNVRVLPLTGESVLIANKTTYRPKTLPQVFQTSASLGTAPARLPRAETQKQIRPNRPQLSLPPRPPKHSYRIGVGDVLRLRTKQDATALAPAQNTPSEYSVQDDGSISVPNIGRIQVAGLTLPEAENGIFHHFVEHQVDPSFSLDVAKFRSQSIAIGGAVATPANVPVTLSPLRLDAAIAAAGGIRSDTPDYTTIRLYRQGALFEIPLAQYQRRSEIRSTQLVAGDSLFVDTAYELAQAQTYFAEQIALSQTQTQARAQALKELQSEITLRREGFKDRIALDAVERDYAYVMGEVAKPGRFTMPFDRGATLADALFEQGGLARGTGNPAQIYVLRASPDPRDFGAVTAWHLDARNIANITLASRMNIYPNDVVFVAEQPITRWNRFIKQLSPSLLSVAMGAALDT